MKLTETQGDALLDVADQCKTVTVRKASLQVSEGQAKETSVRKSYREALEELANLFVQARSKGVPEETLIAALTQQLSPDSFKDIQDFLGEEKPS